MEDMADIGMVLTPFGLTMFSVLAMRADWWIVVTADWGLIIVTTFKM